jgi:hypothetical protein
MPEKPGSAAMAKSGSGRRRFDFQATQGQTRSNEHSVKYTGSCLLPPGPAPGGQQVRPAWSLGSALFSLIAEPAALTLALFRPGVPEWLKYGALGVPFVKLSAEASGP